MLHIGVTGAAAEDVDDVVQRFAERGALLFDAPDAAVSLTHTAAAVDHSSTAEQFAYPKPTLGGVTVYNLGTSLPDDVASRFHAVVLVTADTAPESHLQIADAQLPARGSADELRQATDRLWNERLEPWAGNLAASRGVRRPDVVKLVAHCSAWRAMATRQLRRLQYALNGFGLGDEVVGVDHIGSTAVPGLAGKPVIDIQLRVRSVDTLTLPLLGAALHSGAFVPQTSALLTDDVYPEIDPDPSAWNKWLFLGTDPAQVYHLHVREHGSAAARLALLTRDYLRAVPTARATYERVKYAAAQTTQRATAAARDDYVQAKTPWFAAEVLAMIDWAKSVGWTCK